MRLSDCQAVRLSEYQTMTNLRALLGSALQRELMLRWIVPQPGFSSPLSTWTAQYSWQLSDGSWQTTADRGQLTANSCQLKDDRWQLKYDNSSWYLTDMIFYDMLYLTIYFPHSTLKYYFNSCFQNKQETVKTVIRPSHFHHFKGHQQSSTVIKGHHSHERQSKCLIKMYNQKVSSNCLIKISQQMTYQNVLSKLFIQMSHQNVLPQCLIQISC